MILINKPPCGVCTVTAFSQVSYKRKTISKFGQLLSNFISCEMLKFQKLLHYDLISIFVIGGFGPLFSLDI